MIKKPLILKKSSHYSYFVKIVKGLCISLAALFTFIIFYIGFIYPNNKKVEISNNIFQQNHDLDSQYILKLDNPDFYTVNLKHGSFNIVAKKITQFKNSIVIDNPLANLTYKHQVPIKISSDKAVILNESQIMNLYGNVFVLYNKIQELHTEKISIKDKGFFVTTDSSTDIYSQGNHLNSTNGFKHFLESEETFFNGDISLDLIDAKDKTHTYIQSKTLEVYNKLSEAKFYKSVSLRRLNMLLQSDSMIVKYVDNKRFPSLDRIFVSGNVVIITKDDIVRGDNGLYYVDKGIVEITDNVRMSVRMSRGKNKISGNKFVYDVKTEKGRLSNINGLENKRVEAVIIPNSTNN